MIDQPRSNRPTPRTPAAIEAELRRRIASELKQAREDADGELSDAALAGIVAHAISAALGWHVEAPEHTRNATLSSRSWRPAPGPRGGGRPPRDIQEREFEERRPPFRDRFERDERSDREGRFERRDDFDERDRDRDYRPPRRQGPPGPRGGGGFGPRRGPRGGGGGGGFGPRRPPQRGR
jgi:hypothetical protein